MMETFAISSSLFSNVSSTIADVDDYNNGDDDDCDKRRKLRKVESNNSYSDSDIYGGASGDECTSSSVFSDNLRFDDYLAKYRITFTDDVRSSSGSDSETDGDGGTHVVALLSSDEMESESVVEQKMANTAQKLHEIFVEGCCALYNDLQNAIEDVEGGRKRAATLDDQENKAAEDELINKNVQANGKENEEEVVVVVAELLDELSSRHCMLERQARQLADDWPKLADAAGTRIRTLTRAMQRLRCEVEQQKRRRNVNSNNFANAAAKGTTAVSVSVTSMMIPSAAAHFRRWLYTSERRLDALKAAVSVSVATFNSNYFAQLQKPEFCCSNESNNKLLLTLQRFRTEHQALQQQIESDGRALLNAAYQQLCAESNNNKNCGGESATGKRTVDRWRRNVEALKNRWHAHWLASLELRQRLDEHIDRLTDRSGRTSATLSRYASDEDGDEDTDSSAGREPLCKRLKRSCGHNSLHNHSQQLLLLALESPLPLDNQQSPHAADDVAAAVATKLKKSDAQSVASYSSGIETASSSMPSAGVCRCHHQQRGKMVPCNSENSRAPSSAFPCEEAVGLSSAASTSAPDIGYSSGENNSVVSEELPSANLNKKSQPAENQVVEKLLSDVENEGASEAAGADVVLSEEGGKPDDFAVASALLTRSYYKMVPLDDAGVTDTELTGGIPRFLFNSSATPPPSGVTTGDSNPHLTDSVIVHIDNCCCGGGGLPRQQQHQQHLSTERSGDDVDRDASIVGDDFAEVMGIMDEQFNAHLQRLRQHGTQWRELRSAKPATADVVTATAMVAACAASSDNTVRRVSSVIGGRVGGSAVDKASCDASSEDEDAVAAVAAFDVVATPPQRSANSSGSLQRRRKRFHRRSAQNVTVNNNMALQPPPLFGGDMFVASHSTALTLRLANVLMDQSVYITGHSSDEETNNNNTNSNGNNNGENFTPTPPKQSMMSRSWLGADAASGGSASLRRSPLSVMSRSAVLDGEKLPLTASRRRRRALRRRTTNGFTSTSRALQNSFLRLAQEQRAEEEISNANLPIPPHLPSNNNNNGGQPQLMFNNNQYYYHYYHHYYDNVKVDLREANVSHPLSSHQNNHHCRHHSASYHAVRYRRRQASIASTHSSSSSSSSNASTHPEESGDAHYEWDDYRDPCDLLMPPSCIHLDRELNNNNNNTGEHQRKECPQDNELPNNNCAETTTSSVIDCCFVNYTRKPSFAVSQQLVPPTLIDDDDFGVELPELLFVDDSTKGSGNSSLSDDAEEPKNSGFSALFAVVRRVERMLRDSDVALNSVENMLRRCGKRNNNKQQVEEDVTFIQATARENLKKLADAAMHLDSSSTNSVNGEQLVELDALHQRWSRLVARLERHNRRQQKQHFKNNNNANESNSCSDGNSGSEKSESGNANDGRRSTMVSISLHAILEDMKAQLHLLVLSDLTYYSPLRLAQVEEVVATRKEILHTLLTYRDDLRELAAGAAASVSLSAKSSAAEGDDALELWALVDLVETSLHNIERSTLALERLRTDFGALCAAFRHLEAKIDRLLTDSADDGVTDESRKSIERELELCQERMNALETACNTLSGQLAVISPPPHASTSLIANDEITEEEAEDNEEAPPDEPSPPFGAAMFADELTRFRDELSRLTLRFQSALFVTSHHCQISNREIDSEKERKFDSTITPTSAATATSQNNQPQSKASITNTIATVNRKRRLNNQSHRFFAAKFTQTTDAIVKVQSVGTQSAISAETFRDYAERIAARKTAKRRTAASCATPNVTNGGATMSGGSPAMPNREDTRKTTLEVDVTTATVLRRRGSTVKNGCRTAANISSTTQLPQRLRAALRDSRLAQFCLGCAIAAALGLLLLTIMAATGTDERNPLLANNYRWTFGPQLTYMQGPPPV